MKQETLISCLYPNKCAACGEIIDEYRTLCDYCQISVNNNDLNNLCLKCGFPKDECCCKYREFHFKGIVSAYRNDGVAKTLYYSYKLGKQRELSQFLARSVVRAVKTAFHDCKFDAVCIVPTSI